MCDDTINTNQRQFECWQAITGESMKAAWIVLISLVMAMPVMSQEAAPTLRPDTPINQEGTPLKMYNVNNEDVKKKRNYPMQPPLIPHQVRGYQTDIYANKCMYCHARSRSEESQAPMISVTHYMDRDGNFLADVSPRRYFCQQCHVAQTNAKPLNDNDFKDIDQLIKAERASR